MQPREDANNRTERIESDEQGRPIDQAPQRIIAGAAADARALLQVAEGRNLSFEGLENFPRDMQDLILALRRMPHRDAVQLTKACKGLIPATALLSDKPGPELLAFANQLGKFGVFDRQKADILRLLRTERPMDGYNVRESKPELPQSFSTANELTITLYVRNPKTQTIQQHEVTVVPLAGGRASSVRTDDDTPKSFEGDGSFTLGRAGIALDDVLGRPLSKQVTSPIQAKVGRNDIAMPRACLRLVRSGDQIRVFECGATNVTAVDVEETEIVEMPRQVPRRRVISRTRLDVTSGESQMLNLDDLDDEQRRQIGGMGGKR